MSKRMIDAAFAAALLCGCVQKPETPEVPVFPDGPQKVELSAAYAGGFVSSVKYSVFTDIDNVTFALPFGTTMSVGFEEGASNLYAASPARVSKTGIREQKFTVSANQCAPGAGFVDGNSFPMIAKSVIADGQARFDFAAIAGALELKLSAMPGEKVDSLTLSLPGAKLNCGTIVSAIDGAVPVFAEGDESAEKIRVSFEEPVDLAGGASVYVALARQKFTSASVSLYTSLGTRSVTIGGIDLVSSGTAVAVLDLAGGEFIPGAVGGNLDNPVMDDPNAAPDDYKEDLIPDFSRCGYRWSDRQIPDVPVVTTIEAPSGGEDAYELIQNAINAVSGRGAVLLKAGTYKVSQTIKINKSGVVLRGEGVDKTRILATGTDTRDIITVGSGSVSYGSSATITEKHVPVGRLYVAVDNPGMFSVGDRVAIYRPGTSAWISAIKMDQITMAADGSTKQWSPSTYNMYWERVVTAVVGNRVYFENPVVMALDEEYGGGKLYQVISDRINECGVENLTIDSEFDASLTSTAPGRLEYVDSNHPATGIAFTYAEHSWARNLKIVHYDDYGISLATGSKNITVTDVDCDTPVGLVEGGHRYAFCHRESQLSMFVNCTCNLDRHQFVTGATVPGPDIFLDCMSTRSYAEAGPHQRWSTGLLYDCVKADAILAVQDRGNWGTGHGWAGANFVFWNCESPVLICQSPWVSAKNYAVGCIGEKRETQKSDITGRPDGEWASLGTHVTSGTYFGATADGLSLYRAQLTARRASIGDCCPANCYE